MGKLEDNAIEFSEKESRYQRANDWVESQPSLQTLNLM